MLSFKNWKINRISKCISATALCIRFPFLYPRNRFSGLHYTNWKLSNYITSLYCKYQIFDTSEDAASNKRGYYFKKIGTEHNWAKYWLKWWPPFIIKILKFYHEWILSLFHCIPSHTELDALDDGWRKAFGIEMCKELRKQLIKEHHLFSFRIVQLKEKYGTMRLYTNCASKKIYEIIAKYENISRDTCIHCGKEAVIETHELAWKCPYCQECYDKYHQGETIEYFKKDGEWKYNEELEEF